MEVKGCNCEWLRCICELNGNTQTGFNSRRLHHFLLFF